MSTKPKLIARWESSQGKREDFGFFPKASAHGCRWAGAPGGLDPCAVWAVLVLRGKDSTVHCRAIQMEHRGCTPGTAASGSHLERKHLSITFCLKNSEEPLQFSLTSCGITKIRILHISYVIHPLFSSHICYCYFSFKQRGGRPELWARIGCYTPQFLYSFFGENFRAVAAASDV